MCKDTFLDPLWRKMYSAASFPRLPLPPNPPKSRPAFSLSPKNLQAAILTSKNQAKRPLCGLKEKADWERFKSLSS